MQISLCLNDFYNTFKLTDHSFYLFIYLFTYSPNLKFKQLDAQSRQQNLNLQREKIELQGKFELLENEMREAKMHLSIVNEQLKMSEENCARFLKDLQISEQVSQTKEFFM